VTDHSFNHHDLLFTGATRRTNARKEAIAVNTMDLVFVHMVPPPSRPVFSAVAVVLGVVLMFRKRMLRLVCRWAQPAAIRKTREQGAEGLGLRPGGR
jgi:hypothetical protein